MFWMAIVGVLFIIVGLVYFLKPEWIWMLTEQWKSYGEAEPSDFYRISTKFAGIIFCLIGIAAVIIPVVLPFIHE